MYFIGMLIISLSIERQINRYNNVCMDSMVIKLKSFSFFFSFFFLTKQSFEIEIHGRSLPVTRRDDEARMEAPVTCLYL